MPWSGPFPPEIVLRVVHYLSYDQIISSSYRDDEFKDLHGCWTRWGRIRGVSRYASIDRTWQDAIERETFAQLHLDLERLVEAHDILNRVLRRRSYIRFIHLNLVLHPAKPGARQRGKDNRVLQHTFEALLSLLADRNPGPPLKLYVDAQNSPQKGRGFSLSCHSPLELENPERILNLKAVNAITHMAVARNEISGRHISGAAICTLLKTLSATKAVSLYWRDDDDGPDARSDFAKALDNVEHDMDSFQLDGEYVDQNMQQPAHVSTESKLRVDDLSRSLGILSQRLRQFNIVEVAVTDDIFLQYNAEIASTAHWPRLQEFHLYYPGESVLPHSYASDIQQATAVATDALNARSLKAARAALNMPHLEEMTLVANGEPGECWHKFRYSRDLVNNTAKVLWTSSHAFVPEHEVLEAWREVSQKHVPGTKLEVEYSDDEDVL
ncbi:hypothetical protein F4680DRAFT_206597 [Xylaria scruposa]|nr:hypothetical protein F4680DRAFT_206597 [Xylaria scruposa]